MSLIGRMFDKLVTKGSLTLKLPGRPPTTHGAGGGTHLTVRFNDRKVAFDIAKNARLGLGEAYMDGRLVIEDGTILDLLEMITGANPWEDRGDGPAPLSKGKPGLLRLLRSNNLKRA